MPSNVATDGYGDGSGYGIHIGDVGGYSVLLVAPWGYLRIGCEVHSVAHWRAHWREIATRQGASVSDADAARILAATEVTP